jgi:amino acid adenylation domain-containing protein
VIVEDGHVLAKDASRIEQVEFWATWQQDLAPVLELPADRVRAAVVPADVEQVVVAVAPTVLDAIARRFSLEDALLGAFQVVLARYSGQDEAAVALPAAVVRTDLSGDPTFTEVVSRIHTAKSAADALRSGSPETQPAAMGRRRSSGKAPFFPHLLVVGDEPGTVPVRFEVKVHLGGAGIALHYDRQLFEPETAQALATHLAGILEQVAADPDRPLSDLGAVAGDERRLLLDAWNDTALDVAPVAIHHLIEAQAARHPDAVAVGDRRGWTTYRELNQRANQLAHHLRGLGVGTESLVGLCVNRSADMVVAMLGVLKAGGAYVPLDPEYPAERLAFMLADAGAPVLVTESALLPRLPHLDAQVVCLDRDARQLAAQPPDDLPTEVGPDNLAYVIYTSGSTGRPKGVMVEHRGIVSLVGWARTTYTPEELRRVLVSTSMCFDLSVFEIFVPLTGGTSLYVAEDLLDAVWPAAEPSLINTVPSVLAAVLGDRALPDSVMTVNLAGEPLGRDLVRATLASSRATRVLNLYGPSEATVYCTAAVIEATADDGERVPIGRPVANTEIYLLDGRRQPVPRGATGEVYIGGAGLARGYLNRPDLTAERFVDHPFQPGARLYRSGDLGRYRSDGTIDFFGRVDDQVKIRGFRIEPAEIEAALLTHPGVAQAAVIIREDVPGQRRLVAYVVRPVTSSGAPAPPAPPAELRTHLARSLPDYMIPAAFVRLDALPRNPSGKLDRPALPLPEGRPVEARKTGEPRTATEVTLAQIWADVLQLPKVGVDEDFFELGGHSLLAAEMVTRVEQTFRRKLPVTLVLQAATIRSLAATLEAKDARQVWRSVFPIRQGGMGRPLFCLHGLAGDVTGYRHLLPYLGVDQPLYGIQCVGLDGEQPPYTSVEDMAAHYISEMRAIQPQGPYLLAGICFGALVAYEMAFQLTTRHNALVALVALVDPTPLPPRTMVEQLRRRVAKFRKVPPGERTSFLVETAGILAGVAQVSAWGLVVARRLRHQRPVPRRVMAMEAVNIKATLAWSPPAYGGPIVLYRSEGLATHDNEDRALAWESLSGPNIDLVDVAGASHESLFIEPHIKVVAEHLRHSIEQALVGVPETR